MNPLNQLREIHFPMLYKFWPLAIGWYLIILLLLTLAFVGHHYWKLRERRVKPRREAISKLQQLKKRYERDGDLVAVAIELSMLLRRAALAAFPQVEVASLRDEKWLNFLDNSGRTDAFSTGAGRVLISAPYQRNANFSAEDVFNLVDDWIRVNLEGKKKTNTYKMM